jgi:hypothetical protein
MKKPEKLLKGVSSELAEGKEMLAEKNKMLRRSKGKVEKSNAKRAAKTIGRAVKSLEDHQEILIDQISHEKSGNGRPQKGSAAIMRKRAMRRPGRIDASPGRNRAGQRALS